MNNKHIYILIALGLNLSTSCTKDDLGTINVPEVGYELPQGGNTDADAIVKNVFDKYGSYMLYQFDTKDAAWSLVNTSSETYSYSIVEDNTLLGDYARSVESLWLSRYSDDFLKNALPRRIYMCEKVCDNTKEIPARYLNNQIAVSRLQSPWTDILWRKYVNSTFLEYCVSQNYIIIPNEFYQISNYQLNSTSTVTRRTAGFIKNLKSGSDIYTITKSNDLDAYIAAMAYRTEAEWASDLKTKAIKQKYNIIRKALEDAGIDVDKITQ